MLIDKLLYLLLPSAVHQWAGENKAKIRAYVAAAFVPVVIWGVESFVSPDWQLQVLALLGSLGAVTTGRSIHNVVTPYELDA
jgi:hypothetical protein